ncbi:hypothetical protein HHK36_013176 [Tetracentron sinense]|uniref:Fungal lipase-type domain-containing protein n=1 Tax=Tetracentron sinense TaxID=13715 RepID=A0A834Z798_TETSI|nr:hypothetical protein HHK36_013176 [Tetracentron sinense]
MFGKNGILDNSSESTGFLSSLLGAGCECEGYNIRIVGHSLGGAVGALLGLRLYRRYPNLHVYSYGTPPCVDSVIAEACSNFVTSIIYNDEFSARLSVSSILRLRAAAIMALSQDHAADSAMICRLARRFLHVSKYLGTGVKKNAPASSLHSGTVSTEDRNNHICRAKYKYDIKGGSFLCAHVISCLLKMPNHHRCRLVKDEDCKLSVAVSLVPEGAFDKKGSAFTAGSGEQVQQFSLGSEIDITENPQATILRESYDELGHHCDTQNTCTNPCFETAADVISTEDPVSQFMNVVPSSNEMSINDPQEVFLPGLVIHIVPQKRNRLPLLWKGWRAQEREHNYRAYIANRQSFKDIIVSPSMFLDHLPWRCHYAMQKILETRKAQGQLGESQMV